ncbi:YcxB family protein [Actinomycetes bacterium KLBMP 9797]
MHFTVSYEPAPDEVTRALFQGLRRQLKPIFLLMPVVLVAAGLVCLLVEAIAPGIAMLVSAAVAPFVMSWATRRIARRQVALICRPTTLVMTDDGYETRTDQSTTMMRWSMFGEIVTTPEFWLFFANRQFVAFLPQKAFDSEQRAALGSFLAARQHAGAA